MDLKSQFDTRCKLMHITRNLSTYDKISVIFFVCDKSYAGLKMMEILLATDSRSLENKAFFTWAKKQMLFSSTDWCEKFAEVLAIIQNYRLAKYLGFDKKDFSTPGRKSKIYTSNVKAVLYKICEELNQDQTNSLIDYVEREYCINQPDKSGKNYLEKKILDWSVKNFINIDENKKIDLEAIIKYLEFHNLNDLMMQLKTVIETADFKYLKDVKSVQSQKIIPDFYSITNKNNLGLCVIINEKCFPKSNLNLKQRWGSNKDVERLKEVFTGYGFRVKVHTDLFYNKLISLLNNYAKIIMNSDSFFALIILSHGSENVIYTSDSIPVSLDNIEMIFQAENCPNLIGKPKIFIVQSCQGLKWQKFLKGSKSDIETEESQINIDAPQQFVRTREVTLVGPQKGDAIIAQSTVQGYASFRDKHNGSWYIEELCKELWKFGHMTDLVDILTLVNNNLRSKTYNGQFMVPSILSSLSSKIQFPFSKENWLKGRQMMFKRLFFELYMSEFLKNCDISHVDLLKVKQKYLSEVVFEYLQKGYKEDQGSIYWKGNIMYDLSKETVNDDD